MVAGTLAVGYCRSSRTPTARAGAAGRVTKGKTDVQRMPAGLRYARAVLGAKCSPISLSPLAARKRRR